MRLASFSTVFFDKEIFFSQKSSDESSFRHSPDEIVSSQSLSSNCHHISIVFGLGWQFMFVNGWIQTIGLMIDLTELVADPAGEHDGQLLR
jgi:hypothetical protein